MAFVGAENTLESTASKMVTWKLRELWVTKYRFLYFPEHGIMAVVAKVAK